jgi:serine O-acetyltransferase
MNIYKQKRSIYNFIEKLHSHIFSENRSVFYQIKLFVLWFLLYKRQSYSFKQFQQDIINLQVALKLDAQAIYNFDPAANSIEEVIYIYPGFKAIFIHRVSHLFWNYGWTEWARIASEYAHSITGIDIHPAATIGHSFAIDHGTGIVIGATTIIGNEVKIYQGVTLGALQVKKELASQKRHPTIQDQVVIYANTTILGGDTIIGNNSVIGGNVWLTESVPSFSKIYNKNEIRIKTPNDLNEPINFSI